MERAQYLMTILVLLLRLLYVKHQVGNSSLGDLSTYVRQRAAPLHVRGPNIAITNVPV